MSTGGKERPARQASADLSARSSASSIQSQREALEERRKELAARKAAIEAKAKPTSSTLDVMGDRDLVRQDRTPAAKERPEHAKPARPSSQSTSLPPAALKRENSALMSTGGKERPARQASADLSARSSASSIQSQREALEERRQQLEARKAARERKAGSAGSPPAAPQLPLPPASLNRDNSALMSTGGKERPARKSSARSTSPSPAQAPASMRRDNSACVSTGSKERPSRKVRDDDPEVEA